MVGHRRTWVGALRVGVILRGSPFVLVAAVLAAGCSSATTSSSTSTEATASTTTPTPTTVPSGFTSVVVDVPASNRAAPFNTSRSLVVPTGWTAEVWARVPGARFATWTPQHQLLVSVPNSGQVVELTPGDSPAAVPTKKVLLSGLTQPQGMAFDTIGGQQVLYVAESDQIDRYLWKSTGAVGARKILVAGLPDTNADGAPAHRDKEIVVGADHVLYVDIGSSTNVNTVDLTAKPPRAVVMAYQPDGKGRVFATGIRNGDGLSFDPSGNLWTAINELDNIPYPYHQSYGGIPDAYGKVIVSYVRDHPPDELAKLTPGRNVGWPYCNPDPDVSPGLGVTSTLQYADLPFTVDVQTNPKGTKLDCAKLQPLERGIPAHSAPLGFHFLEGSTMASPWSNGAVVATHGSWDRTPPRAPAVLWFPWEAQQQTLGNQVDLVTGFQLPNGTRWGRPVDAVPGPDGVLYVTDDTAGAVYRIGPPTT
jgi:glucose/arabinose dehydrogenase